MLQDPTAVLVLYLSVCAAVTAILRRFGITSNATFSEQAWGGLCVAVGLRVLGDLVK
jgi:hypothetical protein